MNDLLAAPEPAAPKKKKRKAKKKMAAPGSPKSSGINVHVNVVNTAGDGKKPMNPADEALNRMMRGY